MILHGILAALAFLSLALTLWQWLAARRFPLHARVADKSFAPPVTLLKPLKGCDAFTEACLRSWFAQEYAGDIQILFGVADEDDPAGAVVNGLIREFPQRNARLVVCQERLGTNAKVSKLAQLQPLAKHEILVVSDADVRVPADFLANLIAPLRDAGVGLVNCFYQLANPSTPAMRWEAIAINADFWSMVLQGASIRKLDFALGAVMAVGRRPLDEIGGFRALADCLADDYQLGHRIARSGHRIELCPVVVDCWSAPMSWRAVWQHQLRWARTIRVCQPAPYFFSMLANATFWPLLWLVAGPDARTIAGVALCLLVRLATAVDLETRLAGKRERSAGLQDRSGHECEKIFGTAQAVGETDAAAAGTAALRRFRPGALGFVPLKDILQTALWVGAFAGNQIDWRGERYRLRRDGTIEKI